MRRTGRAPHLVSRRLVLQAQVVFTVVLAAGVLREISTPVQLGGGGLLLVGVLVALRPTVAVVPPAPEGGPVAETEQLLR